MSAPTVSVEQPSGTSLTLLTTSMLLLPLASAFIVGICVLRSEDSSGSEQTKVPRSESK